MSNQSALLVMDMQNGIVGSLSNSSEIIDKTKRLSKVLGNIKFLSFL